MALRCACGRSHLVDVSPDDPRGDLVALRDGWQGIAGATLLRWAREGRLRAFTLDRGKLVAWEHDLRCAVEASPVSGQVSAANDPFDDPELEACPG